MLPTLKSCLKASRIHNINGKMMRKYGNPLRPVLFVTSIADQAETLDEQHVRMENAWDDTKVNAMKGTFADVVSTGKGIA
ncbi:hypothetical protein Tco_1180379 [Tanacetum coccineum]